MSADQIRQSGKEFSEAIAIAARDVLPSEIHKGKKMVP